MKREFRRGAALNTKNSHGISRAMAAILFKAIHAQSLCGIALEISVKNLPCQRRGG